jgi:hypothetical protein
MTLLIYAGLLYLLGVSIVLAIKPELMFTKEGKWKEFGLGRSREQYTWMPFWLFAIGWAIISYTILLVIASHTGLGGVSHATDVPIANQGVIEPENVSMKSMAPAFLPKKKPSTVDEMKPGYYILDANETIKQGMPKYIYLGPQSPHLVYHNQSMDDGIWKME